MHLLAQVRRGDDAQVDHQAPAGVGAPEGSAGAHGVGDLALR